jgi:hypothetical protein
VSLGRRDLSGAYAVSGVLFLLAAVVVLAMLRPDPRDVGRRVAALLPVDDLHSGGTRPLRAMLAAPDARLAVTAMVLGQMVMVMVMVITSLNMRAHDHGLGSVSLVISSHTLGMYAFSVVSGAADRWAPADDRRRRRRVACVLRVGHRLAATAAFVGGAVPAWAGVEPVLRRGLDAVGRPALAGRARPDTRVQRPARRIFLAAGSLGSGLVFAAVDTTRWPAWSRVAFVPLVLAFRMPPRRRNPDARI